MMTPEELIERDKKLCDIVVACVEALNQAMPYIAPLAAKNSGKGDDAMSALSYMAKALHMAKAFSEEQIRTVGNA